MLLYYQVDNKEPNGWLRCKLHHLEGVVQQLTTSDLDLKFLTDSCFHDLFQHD